MLRRISHLLRIQQPDPSVPGMLIAHGATVPTDDDAGYAPGCLFLDTTNGNAYVNEGDYDDCAFRKLEGASDAIAVTEDVTTGVTVSGDTTTGILISGTSTTAINVTGTTSKAFRAGSYGTPLTATATTEWVTTGFQGNSSNFYIGYGCYGFAAAEDAKVIGHSTTCMITTEDGTDRLQAAQFIACLGTPGGSEAAILKTLDGDATAGMYGVWAKVFSHAGCTCASGSRVAPIWCDNQMSGTVSGEEYGIFATTGGTKPDAFIGFETTGVGYDQLLYFDETFNSGAGNCVETSSVPGTQDARIKVYYDGKQYYLPLYR